MDVQIKCVCPGSPHETDRITLRDKLDFHTATTIRKALALVENDDPRTRTAEVLATLSEFYVLMGVESWSLVDEKGKLLEVSQSVIRAHLLESPEVDLLIEAADDLYNQAILLPLLARVNPSSPPTPTPSADDQPLTSQTTESPTKRQKQSRQSSTTTTPTADTETTTLSLVGGSSSSQSSQSAA